MNINMFQILLLIFSSGAGVIVLICFQYWKFTKQKRRQEKYFRDKYGKF